MNGFEDSREVYTDQANLRAAFSGSLPNDPPLLHELGIDLRLIKAESLLPFRVLSPSSFSAASAGGTSDLTGPILFLALFTALLILHGKLHFGYIYLLSLCSCFSIYLLLNLVSVRETSALVVCSVLGYSLGPVILYALLNIGLRWTGLFVRVALGLSTAVWSAYTASIVFCKHLELHSKQFIVGYPLLLTYMCFILMILF